MTTKGGFQFDGTVSLGNLLSIATVVVGLAISWAQLDARMAAIEREQNVLGAAERQSEGRIRTLEVGFASATSDIKAIAQMIARIEAKLDQLSERSVP